MLQALNGTKTLIRVFLKQILKQLNTKRTNFLKIILNVWLTSSNEFDKLRNILRLERLFAA